MSWSRGLLAAALVALSACGFRPLYGPVSDAPGAPTVQAQLEMIRIVPPSDRIGLLLYNNLRDRLNPRGVPAKARYSLTVALREDRQDLLLRQDETASRTNLTVNATYTLRVAESQKVLVQGTARSRTAYNILESEYATRTAADDARARAALELAEGIRERLGVYFSQAPAAAASAP